jgi:hypothetical protein
MNKGLDSSGMFTIWPVKDKQFHHYLAYHINTRFLVCDRKRVLL